MPVNPYGQTKLVGEQLLAAAGMAHDMDWIALRYFNAVGADDPQLADHGATNLLPRVFQALANDKPLTVAGDDYPTRDGTGVRDYVHVADLAEAHLAAVERLSGSSGKGRVAAIYNVGTGRGYSVLEVLATVEAIIGRPVPYTVGPRRPGDSPEVVASAVKIRRDLGWAARLDLTDMVRSAWPGMEAVVAATTPDTAL
jgi:UDP-glucose 4-epimerase